MQPGILLGTQLFFPLHFCVSFVPGAGFYKSSWSLWTLSFQERRGHKRKLPPRVCTLPDKTEREVRETRYNRRFALPPSESWTGWRVKKAGPSSVFISIPLASQGQRTGTQERWNETEIKD